MDKFKVFLSYKNSGENGEKTQDAVMAEELYSELSRRGVQTFYSNQTIGLLGEAQYKMAIDDALDDAYVLVAVGTSVSNLNSNWVKYEWDSFYGDILSGRKDGQVLSYIDRINMLDLPRTLRQLQSYYRKDSSVAEVCDFICNFLKTIPEEKVTSKDCKVLNLIELSARGISALDAEKAFSDNDKNIYEGMPPEVAGTPGQWAAIIQKSPDFTSVVIDDDDRIYGNYSLIGLTQKEEKQMARGELIDADLNGNNAVNLYKPGNYTGYLLNLSVDPILESSDMYDALWDDFINTLKKAAVEDQVFFTKIYYKAFLPEHEARVAARGFRFCCQDKLYGNVYVHDMDPESTLFALDQELAQIYSKAKNKKHPVKSEVKQIQEMDALTAYMDLWKQLEELFYLPDYCRLKKYFMGGKGIPQNSMEYKKGLAVSEWIRDVLQYSEALLPFIPEEQQSTYWKVRDRIYSSDIVQDSINHYQFTTEEEDTYLSDTSHFSVKALITFAHIWMDIDRLFMLPELVDYKQYFYENSDKMPPEEDQYICEMLTMRILSVFKVSEDQLRQLPIEYTESYYNYKDMICSSRIAQHVIAKTPFMRKELFK